VATGLGVQVCVVASGSSGNDRRILCVLAKLLESVEHFLVNEISLLDPAFEAGGSAHLGETLFAVENLDPLTVGSSTNLVVNLGKLIAQRDLRSGNIVHFKNVPPCAHTQRKGGRWLTRSGKKFCGEVSPN